MLEPRQPTIPQATGTPTVEKFPTPFGKLTYVKILDGVWTNKYYTHANGGVSDETINLTPELHKAVSTEPVTQTLFSQDNTYREDGSIETSNTVYTYGFEPGGLKRRLTNQRTYNAQGALESFGDYERKTLNTPMVKIGLHGNLNEDGTFDETIYIDGREADLTKQSRIDALYAAYNSNMDGREFNSSIGHYDRRVSLGR